METLPALAGSGLRMHWESIMKHSRPSRGHPVVAFTITVLLALAASVATLLPDHAAKISDSLLILPAQLVHLVLP